MDWRGSVYADWYCFMWQLVPELSCMNFSNANRERVMYPMATFDEDPDLSTSGPQDQVSVGQIIETEDGKEKVIAVDGQGAYVTEVIDQ